MMFTNPDRALVDLLLAVLDGGPVFFEPDPHDPGVAIMDSVIRVDTTRSQKEQADAVRRGLTDILVANLEYLGELAPLPRERMRLLDGGAR